MELTHDFTVPAPIESAWATFMDLERVGGCFPGASVDSVTADSFSGSVKVKLGPIALVYLGSGAFLERDDAAHRAVIEAKGKDKRGNGTAGATVTVHLTPAGDGTRVDVTTDLAITGKPAQFGRGVMQDVSDKLLQQFVQCIEGQFTAADPVPAAEDAEPSEPEASPPALAPAEPEAAAAARPAAEPAAAEPPSPTSSGTVRPVVTTSSPPGQDDALDLGATVLPVLLKSYAPHLLAALTGLAIGILIGRRRG